MKRFVSGMENGTIVKVADDLLGKRTRRRSSGSKLLDQEATMGWSGTGGGGGGGKNLTKITSKVAVKKRGSSNILHNADAFSLVVWNHHRKLVAESFSWAMQLLMLMHTPISRKAFQYLDCQDIGYGQEYTQSFVRADYSIQCVRLGGTLDSAYVAFLPLALAVLCGFTLMLPFGIITFLIIKRNDLYSPDVLSRIGWLYNRLNRGVEFWEVHEMLRKMILTGVVVFFPRDPAVKATLALTICICAQVSLALWRPHRSKVVFITAQLAYAMALVMYLMATMLAFAELTEEERVSVGILLIVLQASFVIFGVSAIVMSLVKVRAQVKDKRRSLTVEAHVAEAERRRSSAGHEKRSSLNNMINRLQGVAHKVVDNHEALAIMKRHSHSLKQRLRTINIMKKDSRKKVESRLRKRGGGSAAATPTRISSGIIRRSFTAPEENTGVGVGGGDVAEGKDAAEYHFIYQNNAGQ